jgi:cystathionine beta-lyase/cystathionine gamma-synthase
MLLGEAAQRSAGGESLITVPVFTSHAGMTAEERRKSGISNALVQLCLSVFYGVSSEL